MGLLKFIIVGAAVGYGLTYITKKNEDGRSILDGVAEKVPDWVEKAKKFTEEAAEKVRQTVDTVA